MTTDYWLHFDSGPGEPVFNMALDEALLQSVAGLGAPVLRFYGWTAPAATFGYFQKFAEVETVTPLRPLIRRPTGGGLVPHTHDWTYSLVVPPDHAWYEVRAGDSYAQMHRWLQSAFAETGVATELAPCCRRELPGQCFAGYEKFDLLHCGRKLAGAAQRRNKLGLLIQGSIQPPPEGLTREQFMTVMVETGSTLFGARAKSLTPHAEHLQLAERLVEARYSRADYNHRR